MPEGHWGAHRPQAEVVDLLERLLFSAKLGHVRSVALVCVNPVHKVETATAGDLSEVRTSSLVCGLTRITNELIKQQ